MQSRLPDINTAFNTHRKRAIIAIENKDWAEALGALYCINASLPEEYRVIISTKKYRELVKIDEVATCTHCNEETDYNKIKILKVILVSFDNFITGNKEAKIWYCIKCKKENRLHETKIDRTVLSEPYYLGIVSNPPPRQDGVLSRLKYNRDFERWAWTMLGELEQKMAIYRDDNWDRGDDDDIITGGPIDTSWEDRDANNQ